MLTTSGQQFMIAVIALIGDFILVGMLFFINIPADNERILDVVIGVMIGIATTVAAFYFPSSVGARAKDEALNKLADLVSTPAPVTPVSPVPDNSNPQSKES